MRREGQRIAFACDNSDASKQALRWCIRDLVRSNDVIILIHIATCADKQPPTTDEMHGARFAPSPTARQPCVKSSWRVLEELQGECKQHGVACIAVLTGGPVQTAFAQAAMAHDCDLAVIWSRCAKGRTFQRVRSASDYSSSVTASSLNHLQCPVIVYKRGERSFLCPQITTQTHHARTTLHVLHNTRPDLICMLVLSGRASATCSSERRTGQEPWAQPA
jgi:nucleotide-binding universal stress UspA family protein